MRRGRLGELQEYFSKDVLGEITIVVGGAARGKGTSLADAAARARRFSEAGMRLKDAAALVAEETGLRKKEIYDAAI